MPSPVASADSYTTPTGIPLVVAAPGVLANDTAAAPPLSALVVTGSATNGTVSLNTDGSFTFTPAVGFVGLASFRYTAVDDNADESNEATVSVTVGDAVVWAHLTGGTEGQRTVEGDGRGKTTWDASTDLRNRTQAEVLASPKLPQLGDPLKRYRMPTGTYSFDNSYEADQTANENVVVVLVEAKQERDNPFLWRVTVSYEGKDDPTAELPEVTTQDTEYQEYRTEDVYGRPVTNSAFDPFDGGMPVDEAWDSLTITRNLPYTAWDTNRKGVYRNTLNLLPFRLGNQVDANGDPIDLPPGTVRLKRISEQRMVRSKAAAVASAKFYWRVTAELVIDQRVFRPEAGGEEEAVLHRWTVADAGFNTLAAGVKQPMLLPGASKPTEPQLLDGSGGLLVPVQNQWPAVRQGSAGPGTCTGVADVYSVAAAGTLNTVADGLPSVLANDRAPAGGTLTAHLGTNVTATMGTLTLNANGSFTFVAHADFVGYAHFTYTAREDGNVLTDSGVTTVVIFVGAAPTLLAFDRYRYREWTDLAPLLENW